MLKFLVLITIFEITVGNKIVLEVNGHKGNLNFKFVHIIFYLKAFFYSKRGWNKKQDTSNIEWFKRIFWWTNQWFSSGIIPAVEKFT